MAADILAGALITSMGAGAMGISTCSDVNCHIAVITKSWVSKIQQQCFVSRRPSSSRRRLLAVDHLGTVGRREFVTVCRPPTRVDQLPIVIAKPQRATVNEQLQAAKSQQLAGKLRGISCHRCLIGQVHS